VCVCERERSASTSPRLFLSPSPSCPKVLYPQHLLLGGLVFKAHRLGSYLSLIEGSYLRLIEKGSYLRLTGSYLRLIEPISAGASPRLWPCRPGRASRRCCTPSTCCLEGSYLRPIYLNKEDEDLIKAHRLE